MTNKVDPSELPTLLHGAKSENEEFRRTSLGTLQDLVAPWELLAGDCDYRDLMQLSESPIPASTIPFLVDFLKDENTKDKDRVLEILFELSRFIYVDRAFIVKDRTDQYMAWAKGLNEAVKEHLDLYEALAKHESVDVRQMASDLIRLMIIGKGALDP